jgi:hypothetical protein
VTSHQLLWVLYMSILPSTKNLNPDSQSISKSGQTAGTTDTRSVVPIRAHCWNYWRFTVEPTLCRYYRIPSVEPTRGRYTDKTSLSQFLRTVGSTDPPSVLPINTAGLYKVRGQHLRFQSISNRWPRPSLLPLLNPCGDFKNQPCKVILVHFFRFSTLQNIRSSPEVHRFAREASQGIHSKSPSIDLPM